MDCSDKFVLLDDLQFSKRSWHHRNRVRSNTDWVWLTIPTKSEFPSNIDQVKVAGRDWIRSHYDRLRAIYKSAPYFEDVKSVYDLLATIKGEVLTDYTIPVIREVSSMLGIETQLQLASAIPHESERKTDLLIHLTKAVGGDSYVAQPTSLKEYLEVDKFPANGLKLELFEYQHPVYKREGFVAYQSILDLLSFVEPSKRLQTIRGGENVRTLA